VAWRAAWSVSPRGAFDPVPTRANTHGGKPGEDLGPASRPGKQKKRQVPVMNVSDFLDPKSVVAELSAGNKIEVLEELCRVLAAQIPALDPDQMVGILLDRERLGSPGVGEGVAIPHGKMENLNRLVACFGRSSNGVEFEAVDKKPVHLFFLLFAPENSAGVHLKALAKISRLLKRPSLREELLSVSSGERIYAILTGEDGEESTVTGS